MCESEHFPTKRPGITHYFRPFSSNFSKLNIDNGIEKHKTFDMKIADLYIRVSTDEQAEKEIKARESARNHKDTSFVRVRGRKPR